MGHANNTKLSEVDEFDFDYEVDEEALDIDLDFEDDIDSYLFKQESVVEELNVPGSADLEAGSGSKNQSAHSRLPQDWQDFDYGDDDPLEDWD